MNTSDAIYDFYKKKNTNIPTHYQWGTGYFDVIKINDLQRREELISSLSFTRKNLYKIKLIKGKCRCHYAAKTIEINQYALMFINPTIPFLLEESNEPIEEFFCLFNEEFFSNYGNIKEYPVFQNTQENIFDLSEIQYLEFENTLIKIQAELSSNYDFKFDAVRNLTYDLIHTIMKMNKVPAKSTVRKDADNRITLLFEELLAMQFPLHSATDYIKFRKPRDFAAQLSISINHLNKAVKRTRNKTSSEIITERILQEAQILLKLTDWSVSEIAYLLGYETPSRFTFTFRKKVGIPPLLYRKYQVR
ncbi:helix-turn-helix transcriptional regulator [Chryseobacterium sp. WG23]|uniref:helix-turn-helix domain-containing protein n=1 Tax=Chryseobacterium sp. WG23 TaxID=2926910 RepID=UPI00211ED080|nr:response regulator transcription factor [Chryseobacterium sp. WG23]MCQ9636202.1 helix-turn-helix transcriptional regulator [Chryseobacterium sp. WG23]